jgi:hypothetical protein
MWIGGAGRRGKAASAAEELRKISSESVDFGDEHAPVRCPTLVHARRTDEIEREDLAWNVLGFISEFHGVLEDRA